MNNGTAKQQTRHRPDLSAQVLSCSIELVNVLTFASQFRLTRGYGLGGRSNRFGMRCSSMKRSVAVLSSATIRTPPRLRRRFVAWRKAFNGDERLRIGGGRGGDAAGSPR